MWHADYDLNGVVFYFGLLFSLTWTATQYLFLATVQGHAFEKKTMSFSCLKGFQISMRISTKAAEGHLPEAFCHGHYRSESQTIWQIEALQLQSPRALRTTPFPEDITLQKGEGPPKSEWEVDTGSRSSIKLQILIESTFKESLSARLQTRF